MKIKDKIIVIGDIMVDSYTDGEVNRISPEAPVPILEPTSVTTSLGGAGNVAKNLTSFGVETYLVGYAGKDWAGEKLVEMTKASNIKTRLFESEITTLKKRYGYPQMLRVDWEKRVQVKKKEILSIVVFVKKINPSVVIISDYAKGCISQTLFNEIIKLSKKMKFKLLVDPKPKNNIDYSECFLMTPNLKEAGELCPGKNLTDIGHGLMKKYNCNVIVTRGENGMDLFTGKKCSHAAPTAKEVCNISGAGDAVIASLAFSVARGWPLDNAVKFANKIAGEVVETRETSIQDDKKIVFTNGCFDILHRGHIDYLEKAAKLGYLIVGLNSDKSMERIKRKPQFSQDERKKILETLWFVDEVVIFNGDTPKKLIEEINPDIYVKSKGYGGINCIDKSIRELVRGRLHIIPSTINRSSSDIIDKIKNG